MNVQLAGMIGAQEIILILLVVLIFFGGKKIPELMRGMGKGVKEYKNAVNGLENELSGEEKPEKSQKQQPTSENSESDEPEKDTKA